MWLQMEYEQLIVNDGARVSYHTISTIAHQLGNPGHILLHTCSRRTQTNIRLRRCLHWYSGVLNLIITLKLCHI